MKCFFKTFIVGISLLSIVTVQGDALSKSSPNVELLGNADGLIHLPEDEYFLLGENMAPGDSVERTLEIKNQYDKPYKLYLRAERITPEEEYDLLEVINVKITHENEVIYDGAVSGKDDKSDMTKNIELGTYNPGDEAKLNAVAVLDGSSVTFPEYANKTAKVRWIFTAETVDTEPSTPTNPSKPNNNISGSTPQTGDTSILGYASLSGASLVALLFGLKKKKNKED